MNTLIKNARIVDIGYDDSELFDIFMENGAIVEIGKNIEASIEVNAEADTGVNIIDAKGNFVLPGLVDMNCTICDPGHEYVEDMETASLSAVRGGFTTITCEPNTKPVIDNKTVVQYIVSKCKEYATVNIYPYGSMSIGCLGKEMAEIGEMYFAGIVAISDGNSSIENASFLRNIFRYSKMFNMPVITHCEDKSLSGKGVMNAGFVSTSLGLWGIPREAEEVIVARNIILAEAVGSRLHIAHVTTKGSVQLIREAKRRGAKVTCETCPHYFCLTDEAVNGYNTLAKVNPPLRTDEDVLAIRMGISDGTIDVIASGHSPTKLVDKNKEFDQADYGISAFETAFSLSYTELVENNIITFSQLVEKMSKKPSEILGLTKKGKIAIGMDGDLSIINVTESYEICSADFVSKAKFSLFEGRQVRGTVLYTIVNGRQV